MTSQPTGSSPASDDRHASAILAVEDSISTLSRKLHLIVRNAATAVDPSLQPVSYRLLRTIQRCGSVQASVAADMLAIDRSVVSRQVRQLEELGLVETRTDPDDGRARILVLTEEGASRMRSVNPTNRTIMHGLLSSWPAEELESFAAQVERLNDAAEIATGPVPQP
ncbi:MarR family winged helix-turn-helix transcriptional regulator [Mycetocola miduiensis]|uniref:Transcriptional regulator, MarR family n=1 Tax=Mycetocola miduiensis TaxID=995034 RepID=A0A1I4YP35_9MICO|nr:MarR family winged helix-turn-helix transcriptional regulator [Mycetocola miduiensis]SFN39795.1 transcriptional regulator, MarR family [Mycetocola miduiensis]